VNRLVSSKHNMERNVHIDIKKKYLYKRNCCLILALIVFSFVAPSFSQTADNSTRIVRILSYNILHGATVNNDFDLDKIAAVIKSVNPDLVALQEVDFNTKRAHEMDLVTELAYRTGMAPLFSRAMKYDGGEYGEGVLSKFSFERTFNNPLPHSPQNEPRSALEIHVIINSGDEIIFIGTHLDHTRDQADRVAQVKKLNELFSENTTPTILAGDLNSTPESDPMKILLEKWTDAGSTNPQFTFPSSEPERRIDYVLFLPADRWRVLESRVIDEKIASDHRPLLTVLELLPAGNRNN